MTFVSESAYLSNSQKSNLYNTVDWYLVHKFKIYWFSSVISGKFEIVLDHGLVYIKYVYSSYGHVKCKSNKQLLWNANIYREKVFPSGGRVVWRRTVFLKIRIEDTLCYSTKFTKNMKHCISFSVLIAQATFHVLLSHVFLLFKLNVLPTFH